jgi:DNA replication protein DnaC
LLLDDVGREWRNKSGLSEVTFDNIIRTRVQAGRTTIPTTNMSLKELAEGYGGGVLSLLAEKSVQFEFSGEDFRPLANKRERDEINAGWTRPIV